MNCHRPILFSFDFFSLAFVSILDPAHHFFLDSPTQGTFRVIKNGKMLEQFLDCIEKIGVKLICYSNKKYSQTAPILKAINPRIKWVYLQCDKSKPSFLTANRAKLSKLQNGDEMAIYGEGFSGLEGKDELRLAVCSAFELDAQGSKKQIIIYENNTQQMQKLKQLGYKYIYSQLPTTSQSLAQLVEIVNKLQKQGSQQKSKQFEEFVNDAPTLEDPKFQCQMKEFHYFENTKNVTLSSGLDLASSPPTFRTPNSMSICSIVFRYLGDKQLYIGSSDYPSKVGGELYQTIQENKILCSAILQTLYNKNRNSDQNYGYLCIPSYISTFNIKQSLIKSYNKAKAYFHVRPYIKNMKTIAQMLTTDHQQLDAQELWKHKKLHGKEVRGLGQAIAISLVCGEQLQTKGLLELLTLYQYKSLAFNQHPKIQSNEWQSCCRVNYGCLFNKVQKIKQSGYGEIQLCLLSKANLKMKLGEIHEYLLHQIRESLIEINDNFPLFQAIFNHYIWSANKSNEFEIFRSLLFYYMRIFNCQTKQLNDKIKNITKINAKFINYLIASNTKQSFDYFVRPSSLEFNTDTRNAFQVKMQSTENFIVYGQCFPIFTFIRWVKSLNPNIQISYFSLLHYKRDVYERKIKMAKSQKRNILFIVDHCQIEEAGGELEEGKSIADLNWGIRTIFVYRLKLGSCKKLKILYDPLLNGGKQSIIPPSKLSESKQEVLKTIIAHLPNQEQNIFDNYEKVISIYIRNKWLTLGLKAGVCEEEIIKNRLKKLVKCISQNNNRLSSILKDKQFNNFQLHFDDPSDSNSLHSNRQISLSLSSDSGTAAYRSSNVSQKEQNDMNALQHLKSVSKAQIILYCLPICICSQRVELIHDIYEYLCAFYLYEAIIEGTWSGNLQGEQLSHFAAWYPRMHKKQLIESQLLKFVDLFAEQRCKKGEKGLSIMGSNDSFTDCLELMRKIEMKNIFCKLGQIFNFASQPQSIFQISDIHGIITKNGQIYVFHKCTQNKKENWKPQCLVQQPIQNKLPKQQNKDQWKFIGAYCNQQIKVINLIKFDYENEKIITNNQNFWVKQMKIIDNKMSSKIIKMHIKDEIKNETKVQIQKVWKIEKNIIIVAYKSGKIRVLKEKQINLLQECNDEVELQGSSWFNIYQLFELKQASKQIKLRMLQQMQIDYIGDGRKMVALAFPNFNRITQQPSKQPAIYYALANIVQKQDGLYIKSIHNDTIYNKFQIKVCRIKLAHHQESSIELQFIAFEEATDCMLIWNQRLKKTALQQIIKGDENSQLELPLPARKFYKVENDPLHVHRIANTILVVSKLGFAKEMLLGWAGEDEGKK